MKRWLIAAAAVVGVVLLCAAGAGIYIYKKFGQAYADVPIEERESGPHWIVAVPVESGEREPVEALSRRLNGKALSLVTVIPWRAGESRSSLWSGFEVTRGDFTSLQEVGVPATYMVFPRQPCLAGETGMEVSGGMKTLAAGGMMGIELGAVMTRMAGRLAEMGDGERHLVMFMPGPERVEKGGRMTMSVLVPLRGVEFR